MLPANIVHSIGNADQISIRSDNPGEKKHHAHESELQVLVAEGLPEIQTRRVA